MTVIELIKLLEKEDPSATVLLGVGFDVAMQSAFVKRDADEDCDFPHVVITDEVWEWGAH